jgi:RNA polymerase sigma factor (sigma-70 family)
MEVSALKYSGGIGLHGRSPLLRLQSDERLVALVRRGNQHAFEVLVARYSSRLLAFCRHLLGSREDAEDVLQEVMAAAFNAMLADDRPINVRPWLYRIARNRCLNHLRRIQAVGVDSMDIHLSDNGATTADKVHEREEFRMLVGDIHELPETQKTALVLREMDALSYDQIAEAMETTVPSVKSLLVRARISLAEAAEARLLSCDEVRIELGEVAEGLRRRPTPLVRRHLRACKRCDTFRGQLKETNKALAALLPIGPFILLKKIALTHLGHSAGSGATAAGSTAGSGAAAGSTAAAGTGAAAAGTGAAAAGGALSFGSAGGFVSAGLGAAATKAAATLAAAAIVTAGAVEVDHSNSTPHPAPHPATLQASVPTMQPAPAAASHTASAHHQLVKQGPAATAKSNQKQAKPAAKKTTAATTTTTTATTTTTPTTPTKPPAKSVKQTTPVTPPGRTQTETDPTVLASVPESSPSSTTTPSSPPPTTTSPSDGGAAATPPPTTTVDAPPTTTQIDPPPTTTTDPSGTPDPNAPWVPAPDPNQPGQ